jgi:hypothetical protein
MKTYRNKRAFFVFRWIFAAALVIVITGCYTLHSPVQSDVLPGEDSQVERIRISAITEFVPDPAESDGMQIKTLVELFDASDSPVKAPCVLRFEFYEFRPLSADPRGRRLLIWPNQNLNDPDTNDEHWKDFLRGYEFYLPLEFTLKGGGKYVLEVTCLMDQQRCSDLFEIRYQP